jgi:hypothetical protein
MKKADWQIIGVCLTLYKIDSLIIDFNTPRLNHFTLWGDIDKRWRFNVFDGLFESNLSNKPITKKDKTRIRKHIFKKYGIEIDEDNNFNKTETIIKIGKYINKEK